MIANWNIDFSWLLVSAFGLVYLPVISANYGWLCAAASFFFFPSNFFGYYLPGSIESPFPVPSLPVYLYACLWSNVAIWPGFTMLQNVFNYDHMFAISSLLLLPLPPGSWWFLSYLRGFNDPSVQGGPDRDCAIVLQWELCLRQSSSEWRGTD